MFLAGAYPSIKHNKDNDSCITVGKPDGRIDSVDAITIPLRRLRRSGGLRGKAVLKVRLSGTKIADLAVPLLRR